MCVRLHFLMSLEKITYVVSVIKFCGASVLLLWDIQVMKSVSFMLSFQEHNYYVYLIMHVVAADYTAGTLKVCWVWSLGLCIEQSSSLSQAMNDRHFANSWLAVISSVVGVILCRCVQLSGH